MMNRRPILSVKNLKVSFKMSDGFLPIVRGFDLDVEEGGLIGIVGESGSGKTVSVRSILGLLNSRISEIQADRLEFRGRDLQTADEREVRSIRGRKIAYVFQDPGKTLNPRIPVGKQIEQTLKCHGVDQPRERALGAMSSVGLDRPGEIYRRLPSQLSGGQCQRVMIAQAVALEPDLIIADEPTSSVDAGLQQTILDLFAGLNRETGTAVVIISHDFDVVRYLCRNAVVMYGGLVMETGKIGAVLDSPAHPYSRELIRCTESLAGFESPLYSLPGRPPTPREFGGRCPFNERCTDRTEECTKGVPDYVDIDDRRVRCVRPSTRGVG